MESSRWLEKLLAFGRLVIPRTIFETAQPVYHYTLAILGALFYRFPSREIKVVAVTGTKGKTSVVEIIAALLEEADHKTASASTVRFKIDKEIALNKFKMTVQGRFFLQRFLRRAVTAGCTHAVIEMTSEGVKQFRHKFIELDALVVTNIAREHIESHGSYENYLAAKLEIAKQLARSRKPKRILIVNGDDREHQRFVAIIGVGNVTVKIYKLADIAPYSANDHETELTLEGTRINSRLPGTFNLYNILAAITLVRHWGVSVEQVREALANFSGIRGRMEPVGLQEFEVIVDYAHTADSLQAVYETLDQKRKLCVLGGTGGGRDHWKRPLMGEIADRYCQQIFLTDEDPYDEDPEKIVHEVASGIKSGNYQIIMDRREAIRTAIRQAQAGDVVIITGKGTDPYIMGARGQKTPWNDAQVAHEELEKLRKE